MVGANKKPETRGGRSTIRCLSQSLQPGIPLLRIYSACYLSNAKKYALGMQLPQRRIKSTEHYINFAVAEHARTFLLSVLRIPTMTTPLPFRDELRSFLYIHRESQRISATPCHRVRNTFLRYSAIETNEIMMYRISIFTM